MKRVCYTTFLLILSFNLFAEKYALIIGVGNYPKSSQWNRIHCFNDREIIAQLVEESGFSKDKVYILSEEKATKKAILDALAEIAKRVKPGDLVYFHFSGHGQQVQDFDGDEADGLDEAIVPYDAPKKYQAGVFNHITDDMLNSVFTPLREKLQCNGHLFITIDACHSGTAVRGADENNVRGTDQPYVSPGWKSEKKVLMPEKPWFNNTPSDKLAPMVVISASMAHQLNYEYQQTGSLTLALSKAFQSSERKAISYRALFNKMQTYMAMVVPNQTPAMEMYGVEDMMVFDGTRVGIKKYFELESAGDSSIHIRGGTLQGLYPGAELSVYPENTYDTAGIKFIARGILAECSVIESILKIDGILNPEKLNHSWAYPVANSYGTLLAKVNLNLPGKSKGYRQLSQALGSEKNIQIVPVTAYSDIQVSQLQIDKRKSLPDRWLISTGNGISLDTVDTPAGCVVTPEIKDSLLCIINKSARARYLRQLDVGEDTNGGLIARIVLIDSLTTLNSTVNPAFTYESEYTVKLNKTFYFSFMNNSNRDLFFNLIEIQANNEIRVIFPGDYLDDPDITKYFVRHNSTLTLKSSLFRATPPASKEVFKLVYSPRPIDLRNLGTIRGDKSGQNPLGDLLDNTVKSRGIPRGSLSNTGIGIQTFHAEFIP